MHNPAMPDPFFLILGFVALACVALYPIRKWRQKHQRYDGDDGAA